MDIKRVFKLSGLILAIIVSALWLRCTSDQTQNIIAPPPQTYNCEWNGIDNISFLDSISCPDEFEHLASSPLVPVASEVLSVKVVYEISSQEIHFFSGKHFSLHFDFCREILGYEGTHANFNNDQYGNSTKRLYYLASVNFYKCSNAYTLEFYVGDQIDADGILTVYDKIKESCYFGENVRFFPSSSNFKKIAKQLPQIPTVDESELYGAQRYQACNTGTSYGYLKKIDINEIDSIHLSRHDIVLVNGLPVDIPVIAGIITTTFQTPLSHINVLSHNRGTPNMALKTAWEDSLLLANENKLICLTVTNDTFSVASAQISDAKLFWEQREPQDTITLECNDSTSGLFDMSELSHESIPLVGAKAANLAEIAKITLDNEPMPIPEGAFAIPFYYYRKHIKDNGINEIIQKMLKDSLFLQDFAYKKQTLKNLEDTIIKAPLDLELVKMVEEKIGSLPKFKSFRFRSSTNAEDIDGFNGAGLYESYSAVRGDSKKTVPMAIKKVFASLWTLRGFDERDYFKIDHNRVAMGILVHRSFPDEKVNGVAITQNIYNHNIMAHTINVQINEISIVNPPEGFTADQLLFHTSVSDPFLNPVIEYITRSNANDGNTVMTVDELTYLARWLNAIHSRFYYKYYTDKVWPVYEFAMDIEFKLDKNDRKLYIKQARPY